MTPVLVADRDADDYLERDVQAAVRALIDEAHALGDVPHPCSRAWGELPPADPRRAAALIEAVLAWARRQHARDLDLALCPDPNRRFLDAGGALQAAAERAQRRVDDARRPRPGDHPGGPVPVWGPTKRRPAA